ncbi:GSCFA domain-containing protein [Flavobacteriaceae bacterium S0825]|uniref:GSCFA domain-containing protein n=1 Tax=Gaetbulibacter sp. S0825 TaxID=2720084 RepID=UPI00142F9F53|nr:GSCFA domain-containing protein [Gaetbulibacter sp. S0825]MCK0108714.1 GSCFA domain-containing protein [Flavobacteriaceae bacterium S0825]NIX64350.1 GSCFA domain-containing protein [Gaetbulibacter sp. S0825]
MRLQTTIPFRPQQHNQIDYDSSVLLLGSCFVENIGNKLDYFKFQNLQNPFGVLFQPLAIEKLITNTINKQKYTEDDIFFHNEQWHCYDAHSKLSHASKEGMLNDLNKRIKSTNQQINESTHIIVTLGTAWVYRHTETDSIVANCHKVPQKKFLKELLLVDEISESLQSIEELIRSVNKKASILFTVSPVRHLKDGFLENMQSKAHLIAAIHQIVEPRNNLHYFPSYEIMMDELRDYRFYTEDMLHPNQTAVNYIWEKFQNVWISNDAFQTMEDVGIVQKGIQHIPFNPNSEAHQKFLKNLEQKKMLLQKKHSYMLF